MSFGHEKLDAYRVTKEYCRLADSICDGLNYKHSNIKDQLRRASESVLLNIAEANGKSTPKDRRKFFEISRASAVECAACLDLIFIYKKINEQTHKEGKNLLDRIVAMLSKLGGRHYFYKKPIPNRSTGLRSGSGSK